MKKFASRRMGFTLVELLIVIVVIGILSAMMMLSSSEAVATAKATAIISDLRNLKTAALAYFADHADKYITGATDQNKGASISSTDRSDEWDEIMNYLNGKDFPNKDSYKLQAADDGSTWYALCDIYGKNGMFKKGSSDATAVTKKLAGRAKSVGLWAARYKSSETKQPFDGTTGKAPECVYMIVQ